ncbi:MAG: PilZ domain-containing protein [Phycisphaerae bacterium]|nr:PilZ domain-containing protein [Phycisphaerae bacterium]NUQ47633.1 PilZ domain-containing protein [Phycisphaerae bacterium]
MFDDALSNDMLDQDAAAAALHELERNTPDQIRRQRTHFRLIVKAKVVIQPGNASDALRFRIQGVTGDISEGGCRILTPLPPRVGDIYRLHFDESVLPLPQIYARCVRCSVLRDDAFEAGFAFFKPIAMPSKLRTQEPGASLV